MHEHSLELPGLSARSPRATALRRRAGQLRSTWLGRGLATVWLRLAATPAAGRLLDSAPRRPPLPLYRSVAPSAAALLMCVCPPCLALWRSCCRSCSPHRARALVRAAVAVASPFMALRPHMPCLVVGARTFPLAVMARSTCTCADSLVASRAPPRRGRAEL